MISAMEEHEFTFSTQKKTFYLAAGPQNGPLLVFIHGWPTIAKTWQHQLTAFALLGFRAVAPDMPGYGRSTVTRNAEDYSQESINNGMLALLAHLGREKAVWIGHDWGCGAVWSFAEHYPQKCTAVVGITVPSHTLELGLEELLKYVDRDRYPEDQYPWGQWAYQKFYETSLEKAAAWFEKDVAAFTRILYSRGNPANLGQRSFLANVTRDEGWFGGQDKPDPKWKDIPAADLCLDEETYKEVVSAMQETGFWAADAWYLNHKRNREYALQKWKNGGYLHMPVLFIGARFDNVCDTVTSRLTEPMREHCKDLTEVTIDAGHWVPQEKPIEVNAAIARWLAESVKQHWPGFWSNAHVRHKV